MRNHPVGLDVWFLGGHFVYFHTSCVRTAKMRTAKALARPCGCAGSPEPSLVDYVISTKISCAGSYVYMITLLMEEITCLHASRACACLLFMRNTESFLGVVCLLWPVIIAFHDRFGLFFIYVFWKEKIHVKQWNHTRYQTRHVQHLLTPN